MFDPFGDFETAGYLRNTGAEKDMEIVKLAEHELFRAQLPRALNFLASIKRIGYKDFLRVHQILFGGLYPWAGEDRATVLPDRAIAKGAVYFCHPNDCQRAIEEGLRLAQDKGLIATHPGFIMGLFAYGHPFLDGNGRTMLLVHAELCFRAGMSVDWMRTDKDAYLEALAREIANPHGGHLDAYLHRFMGERILREAWLQSVSTMPGLDGALTPGDVSTKYSDPGVDKNYQEFERRRAYKLT